MSTQIRIAGRDPSAPAILTGDFNAAVGPPPIGSLPRQCRKPARQLHRFNCHGLFLFSGSCSTPSAWTKSSSSSSSLQKLNPAR